MPKQIPDKHHGAQIDAIVSVFEQALFRIELLADACTDTDEEMKVFYKTFAAKCQERLSPHARETLSAIVDPETARVLEKEEATPATATPAAVPPSSNAGAVPPLPFMNPGAPTEIDDDK